MTTQNTERKLKAAINFFNFLIGTKPYKLSDELMASHVLATGHQTYADVTIGVLETLIQALTDAHTSASSIGLKSEELHRVYSELIRGRNFFHVCRARLTGEAQNYEIDVFHNALAIQQTTDFSYTTDFPPRDYLLMWKLMLGRLCIFSQAAKFVPSREALHEALRDPYLVEALCSMKVYAQHLDFEEPADQA